MDFKTELKLRRNYAKYRGKLVSCTPKNRFKDYNVASMVARNTNARNRANHRYEIVVPYHCPFCNYWHVGKKIDTKKLRSVPMVIE